MRHLHCALLMLLATSFADSRRHASAGQGVEGGAVNFEQDVRPILKTHCFQCHGEEANPHGGLDLRLVRLMKMGGDSGGAIVPGQPDRSLLFQRIRDGEMPPEERKQLTAAQIQRIRQWIADGARTVREEPEQLDEGPLITPEERAHWACQPIIRPHVPRPRRVELVSNPIDAFLLVKLEEQALSFSPPAAKRTLMRRVYLDLLGLPPRPEDVSRFASNNDPLAWNRLIDRLLASPHYGERWATHWLDAAGYADSEGYTNTDAERPHAWRYRDYVIRSLNIDKPFGQFIREQLAGDEMVQPPYEELTPEDVEKLTATGFLRMVPDGSAADVPDSNVARNAVIADTIQVDGSNLPLGIIEPTPYAQFAVPLELDDLIVFYTDALIEARGPEGELIGTKGLLELVRSLDVSEFETLSSSIRNALDAFRGGEASDDDLTVLVLHHNAADPPRLSVGERLRVLGRMMRVERIEPRLQIGRGAVRGLRDRVPGDRVPSGRCGRPFRRVPRAGTAGLINSLVASTETTQRT